MREAVEAEAPQAEALAPFARQGVGRGRRGQRRVKRRVEARDRGHAGQGAADGGDAGQGGGLVQGCELGELAQRGDHVVVDERRVAEARAAVHDAVAHGVRRRQSVEHGLERRAVGRRQVVFGLELVGRPEQAQLEAAGARVDDEDAHVQPGSAT